MSTSNNNEKVLKEMVFDHALQILKKLDCATNVREEATSLIERANKKGLLANGNPKALAAGAVYIACILQKDRMTLDTIGGVVGISGSTVSKNYMTLARGLGFSER